MNSAGGSYSYPIDRVAINAGCYSDTTDYIQFARWCERFAIQSQGEWSGQPIELFEFQRRDIFGPLLSWRKSDGNYRYNLALIFSPKKIGKTTAIAALAGWKASCWRDQQIYVVASKVEQARICFETIREFARHPELNSRWHVKDHLNTIVDRESRSKIKVLACNPSGISGYSADLFILDELAEMPGHAVQTIWDRIEFSGASKRNSQIVVITTPAHDLQHLGYRLYQRAKRLVAGEDIIDTATLPVIYSVPLDADWRSPAVWKTYLPHIDKTVPMEFYLTQFKRAVGDPNEELAFRIYLLGQYLRGWSVFIDLPSWTQCVVPLDRWPDLTGQPAVLGVDNGGANDLLAVTCLVPCDGRIYIDTLGALTSTALAKKTKLGQHQFAAWADRGWIEVIQGETITLEKVASLIASFYERYKIKCLAYDPWHLRDLPRLLGSRKVLETPQIGKYLSPLILDFERKVRERVFAHAGLPLMNFCIENLEVAEDRFGRLEFAKRDGRSKIDLAASAIVAMHAYPEIDKNPDWNLSPVIRL
jgi:phage terminase large subunit-like protein